MAEREVTEEEVEQVLRFADTEVPAKHGRRNGYKVIAGRRIRVTFDRIGTDGYYVWTVTADEVER